MAGASLLTLLDDIASVLDDVALMTKVAAKKTAGVLGDDLALNAEQVSGVRAERELPVVVDRLRARFGAWYELFPRSTSPDPGRLSGAERGSAPPRLGSPPSSSGRSPCTTP